MYMIYGSMYINSNESVKFITNTAQIHGGAIYIEAGIHRFPISVNDSANLLFFSNSAFRGGVL